MNKKIISIIAALVIGAAGGFFGGMKYQQNKTVKTFAGRAGQFGPNSQGGRRGGAGGTGFSGGQVIAKDGKSITVKLNNGGSQIVLLAPSTQYRKAVDGTLSDVSVGSQVAATGSSNADGSLTAQSVQIRSASSTPSSLGR